LRKKKNCGNLVENTTNQQDTAVMIEMFSKDMIQRYIVQYLSQGQRGPECRAQRWEIVNAILYKLKTGVQWEYLPVKSLIFSADLQWGAIYHHFRKWCLDGSWKAAWMKITQAHKFLLDLSTAQFDGSHSPAKRGGEAVAYQGRKKCKTSNILLLTDRNGIVVGCGIPVAGNHNDLFQIERQLQQLLAQLNEMGIPVDGLFVNADSGFDAKNLRLLLDKEGIILNCPTNRRAARSLESDILFDDQMYQERFAVERTNAWNDSFRTLLIRQDTSLSSWWAWHFLAFTFWLLKHRIEKL
jgi:transposase